MSACWMPVDHGEGVVDVVSESRVIRKLPSYNNEKTPTNLRAGQQGRSRIT